MFFIPKCATKGLRSSYSGWGQGEVGMKHHKLKIHIGIYEGDYSRPSIVQTPLAKENFHGDEKVK